MDIQITEVTTEKENENDIVIVILSVNGEIDASTAPQLDTALDEPIGQGKTRIVVDFEKVSYISSGGLRVLLNRLKEVRRQGGDLRLCCLNTYVAKVFDVAGFTALFEIFANQKQALDF